MEDDNEVDSINRAGDYGSTLNVGGALKAPRFSKKLTLKNHSQEPKLPYQPRASIMDEVAKYQSVEEAREHLRELIR